MSTPVDTIYNQRKDFIIVVLTGIIGSGCSVFAEVMAMPFGQWGMLGAIGKPLYKLYQPFMPYKDELALWEKKR